MRTYKGDGQFFIYLLRSLERYGGDAYRELVVSADAGDDADYASALLPLFAVRARVSPYTPPRWMQSGNGGGYHAQMLAKLGAARATDAATICFLDSDTLVTAPLHAHQLVDERGRVGVAPVPFAELEVERAAWQPGCEALLRFPCPHETMTGFPICYPRELFDAFEAHVRAAHNATRVEDVLRGLPAWNEFTPMGAYLMARMPAAAWKVKPQVGRWWWKKSGQARSAPSFAVPRSRTPPILLLLL